MPSKSSEIAETIPKLSFNNGRSAPVFGLGTWKLKPEDCENLVYTAIVELGYRHIDCAAIYFNEAEVGRGIQRAIKDGIKREDLFIVSKLWNTHHGKEHVQNALKDTLKRLQLDYLDLYMMHWPIATEYTGRELTDPFPSLPDGTARQSKVSIQETWRAMEECQKLGLTASIGVANFTVPVLLDIMRYADIKPVCNQIECHPYLMRQEMIEFFQKHGVAVIAYSPLGSDGFILKDPIVQGLAKRYRKTPAQILLRWNIQRGNGVIPKASSVERLKENIDVFNFKLSDDDMKSLNSLNRGHMVCNPTAFFKIPLFASV